ncbi:MAG: hypothetical protein VCE74_04755, partial [Alphaproteobacteria bacterium]
MTKQDEFTGVGLPAGNSLDTVLTGRRFEALENFFRTFAIRPGDRMVFLADRKLDPRVIHAICGLARARGVDPWVVMNESSQHTEVPAEIRPMLEQATFVVSTWFCSIIDPFCIALRGKGQRWVKITYFRDLDLLDTPQARFPIDLVGEIIRQTAAQYPSSGNFDLHFTCPRGTDLTIKFSEAMRGNLLGSNRWRGQMTAEEPGAYVHYLPTHGPNLYDRTSVNNDDDVAVSLNGVVVPNWAVGFERPFDEAIRVLFHDDRVTGVEGNSETAAILREMLMGGQIIELGCGFNPKAPRHTIYPAGSNSPGALHYGIDLAQPSDYIRRTMPDWEEPPVHMDLISFDATVTAGDW